MAKSSFRTFMGVLEKRWREEYPFIQRIAESLPLMPKSSSFYVGVSRRTKLHFFLKFQPAVKAWKVGQFTINVILAADPKNPRAWGYTERKGDEFPEGPYRIGHLVGKKDKWWHLQADKDPIGTLAWRPSSYADLSQVVNEAVDDVTRDVATVLRLLEADGFGPNP